MPRIIMHIDLDAFFASVEERDNPAYKHKPMAVRSFGVRGPIASCNYVAKKYGIKNGMPISQALEICPELIIAKPHSEKYVEASKEFFVICKDYSKKLEILSMSGAFDELWLDLTEKIKDFDGAFELGKRIKQEIEQRIEITASVGISYNKLLAKMASDLEKPDGLMVIRNEEDFKKRLYPLSVEKLFGVGNKTKEKLQELNVFTIQDLSTKSLKDLVTKFGDSRGNYLHMIARGIDDSNVVPYYKPIPIKSLSRSQTLYHDTLDKKIISTLTSHLSSTLSKELQERGWHCKTLALSYKFEDFTTKTKSKTVRDPVMYENEILAITSKILSDSKLEKKVRGLGVGVSNLVKDYRQLCFRF